MAEQQKKNPEDLVSTHLISFVFFTKEIENCKRMSVKLFERGMLFSVYKRTEEGPFAKKPEKSHFISNNDFEDFVNEARNNLKNKNLNEQKDRIIWNLIGNGKSEYTDCEKFINTFYNEVINTPKTEWFQNFNNFTENLFNRKYKGMEKRDNNTIFRMGIPIMVSLFQANYVTGRTALEWKNLIDFYFLYNDYSKDLDTITPRLIECLCYCELSDRSFYLYVINKFNNLKVTKNLNSHKSYKRFLLEYLSMFSTLGFCDTHDIWDLRDKSKEYIDTKTIEKFVFSPLKKKLKKLLSNVKLKIVQKDIEIIIKFLDKNIEIIKGM